MNKNRLLGFICIIAGIIIILLTALTVDKRIRMAGDPGPTIFPYISAGIFIVSGLSLLVRKEDETDKVFLTRDQWGRLFLLFGVLCIYILIIYLAGFSVGTFCMMFVVSTMFAKGQGIAIWKRIVYALVMTLIIWAIFRYGLKVLLPSGIIAI
jgi:hypothetical protein